MQLSEMFMKFAISAILACISRSLLWYSFVQNSITFTQSIQTCNAAHPGPYSQGVAAERESDRNHAKPNFAQNSHLRR
jgi:hypothetical protein